MHPFRQVHWKPPLHRRWLNRPSAVLLGLALAACGGGDSDSPPSDPLVSQQWHLQNTGQAAYSDRGGVSGVDLNVASLFDGEMRGDGVKVLVIDDGLDIRHPDLKDRIDDDMLRNFDINASTSVDPTPTNDDSHGTAVGGIIGATANNGIGGRGVAPGVRLGGARYLCERVGDDEDEESPCGGPIDTLDAYGGAPFSRSADIMNASYGVTGDAPPIFDPNTNYQTVALQRLATLRSGRGIVFVKAAGNDFYSIASATEADCSNAIILGITCVSANMDPESTMPQALVIAAVNADGVKSSYSTAGSNILVSGLGGEFGFRLDRRRSGPALITADLAGCNRGSVKNGVPSPNELDNPGSPAAQSLNPNCDYMATMNGTSAATPSVTGVIALMLQANPRLTWRDVRVILTQTARRVDQNRVATAVTLASGERYVPEPAWTRNAAGYWFDNWYGFGLVDAGAAVAMARSYNAYLAGAMQRRTGQIKGDTCTDDDDDDSDDENDDGGLDAVRNAESCGTAIPLGVAAGVDISIPVGALGSIEAIQIQLAVGEVSLPDLAVELISPSGTRSVLLSAFSGMQGEVSDLDGMVLASNAFNGEAAQGSWTLRLIDVAARQAPQGSRFLAARLNVFGH